MFNVINRGSLKTVSEVVKYCQQETCVKNKVYFFFIMELYKDTLDLDSRQ